MDHKTKIEEHKLRKYKGCKFIMGPYNEYLLHFNLNSLFIL